MKETSSTSLSGRARGTLISFAFALFATLVFGVLYLAGADAGTVNLAFAYVVGLSMIVLPCTLPLAFVIVPLAMGKSPRKGLIMAVLFGLGLSVTLALYGVFIAALGAVLGLDQAIGSAGSISKILFIIGGLAAFIFGLSELGLIRFSLPSYSGAYPEFIVKQKDYLKAFFLGLFLGNAGVGCPNPLFYVLLADIAVIGDIGNGAFLGFVHGVGRATPLIFLTILGILGVNAVGSVASKTKTVKKWSGIALVLLGAFIFITGASHKWYESSVIHTGWNKVVATITAPRFVEVEEMDRTDLAQSVGLKQKETAKENDHEDGSDLIPYPYSMAVLAAMIIIPLVLYHRRSRRKEQNNETGSAVEQ